MTTTRSTAQASPPTIPRSVGVGLAFALGFAVVPVVAFVFALEMMPTFALVGVGGFVSVLVRPGWWGFVANVAGLAAYALLDAAMSGFAGLQFLALVFMVPTVAVGAACATIVNLIRAQGLSAALADRRLWTAAVVAVVLAAGWAWLYLGILMSGSPP